MDNLLKLAIEAHDGLKRWRQFNVVKSQGLDHGRALDLKVAGPLLVAIDLNEIQFN